MLPLPLQRALFASVHYVDFIKAMIQQRGGERGYQKRLAECAGCQPAYLSHVLSGNAHLTPEHADGLRLFWDLTEIEGEYFSFLVAFQRAGSTGLRARIQKRLLELRVAHESEAETYSKPSAGDLDRASVCYRTWKHSAVHILLTVPACREPEKLAQTLDLGREEVLAILHDLVQAGLAVSTEKGWQSTQAQIHTTQKDFFAEVHHRNWRVHALEPPRAVGQNQVRFTMLHTLSHADFSKVCQLIEQLILDSRALIEPSREEMGACLLIDYFALKSRGD